MIHITNGAIIILNTIQQAQKLNDSLPFAKLLLKHYQKSNQKNNRLNFAI